MSQYLRNIVHKETFDGDEVTMTLKPLEFVDALKFRGLEGQAVADVLRDIMPRYILEVKGLRAADGTEVTKEDVVTASYFSKLVISAGLELAKRAQPANP